MSPRLMTSQQAADVLRVHRSTVHRAVTSGKLEPAQTIYLDDDTATERTEDQKSESPKGPRLYLFDPDYIAELAAAWGVTQ